MHGKTWAQERSPPHSAFAKSHSREHIVNKMGSGDVRTSKETAKSSEPRSWNPLGTIPRAAILSLIGPAILLFAGYFGWRYYGAKALDSAYYALSLENIHLTPPPFPLRANIVAEVYEGSGLSQMSLLDDQTAAAIARAFTAHPWIRQTHRVQKMAGGQIMVNVEYRIPIAMVYCEPDRDETSGGPSKESFLPIDADGVLLPTKDFSQSDIPEFILIYANKILASEHRRVGTPIGDSQIEEAILLSRLLAPVRKEAKISSIYVYPSRDSGRSKWKLEIATRGGPRIFWGSAPGIENFGEPSAASKSKRLLEIVTDKDKWAQSDIDLTTNTSDATKPVHHLDRSITRPPSNR